jgi:hypothetical protein
MALYNPPVSLLDSTLIWLSGHVKRLAFVLENPQSGKKQEFNSYQVLMGYIEIELANR